jgi:hypothetical protein
MPWLHLKISLGSRVVDMARMQRNKNKMYTKNTRVEKRHPKRSEGSHETAAKKYISD